MLKERELAVNNMLAGVDVIIALVTFNLTAFLVGEQATGYHNRDLIILNLLTVAVWFIFSKRFRLGELYRSRPYSIVLFNCAGLSFLGGAILALAAFVLKISFASTWLLGVFIIANMSLTFSVKVIIYKTMKSFRKQGLNSRTVIIKGDKSAIPLIREMLGHNEWGYRIVAIVGDGVVFKEFASQLPIFSPENINIDELIAQKAIDELIYCKAKPNMEEMETLLYSCSEVGVIFRMYSPFFNMLTNKTHIHYFNTHGLLTFSNTPQDYLSLKAKRFLDFFVSLFVISMFSPLFIVIAIIIKTTSKGPVFFKQVRVGLRGRRFWVYKFRTMVTNAEELKHKLMDQNEMDGPVFKITNDPRITGVGNFLRKTSLDELPQFFNVFLGQMSIVGPRPPIPAEVKQYERWQLRRLSMKPGITCIWQISPSRNDISFEDWMRMDLDYIDNWSLKYDFVIILKTVRAVFRADGK